MDTTQHDEADVRPGDLLVGAAAIRAYLIFLGMPEEGGNGPDPYYLKPVRLANRQYRRRRRKPIASKRRLARHTEKLTRAATPPNQVELERVSREADPFNRNNPTARAGRRGIRKGPRCFQQI